MGLQATPALREHWRVRAGKKASLVSGDPGLQGRLAASGARPTRAGVMGQECSERSGACLSMGLLTWGLDTSSTPAGVTQLTGDRSLRL